MSIIIGIAGGTASGKTTIANKLFEKTEIFGSVFSIKMDDYYKELKDIPCNEYGEKNFDHPNSYDLDLFIRDLHALKKGRIVTKPTYDFVQCERGLETEIIPISDVILVEGILTFATQELRNCFDIKVFVDTPDDIRFIRRLKRDIRDRGRTVDSVINQYLKTVRPMHEAFVEPSKKYADLIIPEGGKNVVAIDILTTKIITILDKRTI